MCRDVGMAADGGGTFWKELGDSVGEPLVNELHSAGATQSWKFVEKKRDAIGGVSERGGAVGAKFVGDGAGKMLECAKHGVGRVLLAGDAEGLPGGDPLWLLRRYQVCVNGAGESSDAWRCAEVGVMLAG